MAGFITPNAITITNLNAPNVYVQILQPTPGVQGVATNVVGIVGTASWGPLNTPTLVVSPNGFKSNFAWIQPPVAPTGAISALTNPYEMASAVAAVFAQSSFAGGVACQAVRVSDGTDTKATLAVKDTTGVPLTGGTLTALYSGSLGNNITITIAMSKTVATIVYFNVTLTPPAGYGLNAEFYPNLQGGVAAAVNSPFWFNLQNALANGIPGVIGPSLLARLASILVTAENPGIITASPMTGGTDGILTPATTLTNAVGSAASNPYTGLFSLIGASPSPAVAVIAGFGANASDLSTNNATIQTFIDSSACEFFADFPLGDTTAAAVTIANTPASGGVVDYNFSFIKDWAFWNDGVSGLRFYPMAPFAAGVRGVTQPWNSLLNLQVKGIMGTYRTVGAGASPYSPSETGLCNANGILLVTAPSPGGAYVGFSTGVNSSMLSNPATGPEEFASMTNYLAKTFAGSFGLVVGQPQTNSPVDPLRKKVRDNLNGFLGGLATRQPAAIQTPYLVTCDTTNNKPASVAAHFINALVTVTYLSTVWYFVISLNGGNTVQVSVSQGS